ncbi:MAG TPA: Gfo/Idh/MocA family oxidoreductase [Candidatus Limnocylindrales bacterium]
MPGRTEPVRWGILGTGGINRRFLGGAAIATEGRVVAVASRDADRASSYAAANGIERAFGAYEALLASTDVEAVYVSLPNSLHHPWTMAALAAGKHVLSEKPYTRRPAEVDEAFDAAERAGLVLAEGFMWRYSPQTERLVEESRRIGELRTIRSTFSFVLDDTTNIRLRAEVEGGCLMDVGCYCVSAARLLTGEEPVEVVGLQEIGPTGVDIRFSGLLRFPSGVVAEITSGFGSAHQSIEAVGREGSIQSNSHPWHDGDGWLTRNGTERIEVPVTDPYALEIDELSRAIRGGPPPRLGRADALGQARTIAALYASAASGCVVRP